MEKSDQSSEKASRAATAAIRKQQYLIVYNLVSAVSWFIVLSRVCILLPIAGYRNTYAGVGEFAKWTQTGAVLEIVHSAIGTFLASVPYHVSKERSRRKSSTRIRSLNPFRLACCPSFIKTLTSVARPCSVTPPDHFSSSALSLSAGLVDRGPLSFRHDSLPLLH